ncbi:S4 domain-containing protein [Rhizomonospora bruguierae]|uniref:S4 domain-containing protein n=1 Tax=Rhizomonospora bruguierae TaxID=1581705 RepID=UPI001BCAC219|nr:S4 domain-containing protein [Micromonospora sp. NBRC 107566]
MASQRKLGDPADSGLLLTPRCAWYLTRRRRRRRGAGRSRPSAVAGLRLPVAQRRSMRAEYNLRGRQLGRLLSEAIRQPGDRAEGLIAALEQRVDVVAWRAGLARTLREARNLVGHHHFTVDGVVVDLPAHRLSPGQTVRVRDDRVRRRPFLPDGAGEPQAPPYLEVQPAELRATLTRQPRRQEVDVNLDPAIVEAAGAVAT